MATSRQFMLLRNLSHSNKQICYKFSTSRAHRSYHYKLVVVGGGTGGSAIANKYTKKLGVGNVAVIEPSEVEFIIWWVNWSSFSLLVSRSKCKGLFASSERVTASLPPERLERNTMISITPFTPSDAARDATCKWVPHPFPKRQSSLSVWIGSKYRWQIKTF